VPLPLLEQHGVDLEQTFAGRDTPSLRAAIGKLADEARSHLEVALGLLPNLPPQSRGVYLPLVIVRRALNDVIGPDINPFVARPVSRLRILWTMWRASRTRPFCG
jgi:phytoene synthase